MPMLEKDFSQVTIGFEPLPDGDYLATIDSIKEDKTKESQLDEVIFELTITGNEEYNGRKLFDYCVLKTKKGEDNNAGWGRVKEYAIAALGEERANAKNLNTDEMIGSTVTLVVKQESYPKKDKVTNQLTGEKGISNRIKKVLAA